MHEHDERPGIRLMPDYFCHPLWWDGPGDRVGNVDPSQLPLRAETRERLQRWAEWFESGYNDDDPSSMEAFTPEEEEAFDAEGRALLDLLRTELGAYRVTYHCPGRNRR
jgi:hypothetical protein